VEKFKFLGVVFTSDGRRSEEIDTRIGKTNAVQRELYRSMVTKRELSNTAKLSVFQSVFVPILAYGHESWVMIEKILSQVQAAEIGFLRMVHIVTFRDKRTAVRFAEPWISNHVSSESRDPSYVGSAMCPECPTKDWRGKSCWLKPRESGPKVVQGPRGVITSPTLLGPVLVWSRQNHVEPTALAKSANQ